MGDLEKLLTKNQFEELFEKMLPLCGANQYLRKNVLVMTAQYNNLKNESRLGVLSNEQKTIRQNNLTSELYDFIGVLESSIAGGNTVSKNVAETHWVDTFEDPLVKELLEEIFYLHLESINKYFESADIDISIIETYMDLSEEIEERYENAPYKINVEHSKKDWGVEQWEEYLKYATTKFSALSNLDKLEVKNELAGFYGDLWIHENDIREKQGYSDLFKKIQSSPNPVHRNKDVYRLIDIHIELINHKIRSLDRLKIGFERHLAALKNGKS